MARKNLKRYILRYTILVGLPSGAAIVAVASLFGVPIPLSGLVLTLLAILVVPGIVGTTDAGIETVSAGAVAGAVGSANPMDFQPESVPIPNRLAVVCWLSGVGVVGLASVVVFY